LSCRMWAEELAANLFRITQTESKLKRESIQGAQAATATHYTVGKKVRQTITDLGGTMPENLPVPYKGISQVERELSRVKMIMPISLGVRMFSPLNSRLNYSHFRYIIVLLAKALIARESYGN